MTTNKPDTWYVQRGVELADDFEIVSESDEWGVSIALPGHAEDMPHIVEVRDGLPRWMLDALAAQLVRQVDDEMAIQSVQTYQFRSVVTDSADTWSVEGPDRTMNTIRAIVDSKVLEGE